MDREELLKQYDGTLCLFCRQCAYMDKMRKQIEKGKKVKSSEMEDMLELAEAAKLDLLRLKKELGFDGGLDFMKDIKFYGFEFKDGSLSGNYRNLFKIIRPFIEELDEERIYAYEVGTMILFHYIVQMGYDRRGNRTPASECREKAMIVSSAFTSFKEKTKGKMRNLITALKDFNQKFLERVEKLLS